MRMAVISTVAALALLLSACRGEAERHLVGTLERDRIELKVESDEPIVVIRVEDGQWVAAGDTVIEQDPARHQARLDRRIALRDQAAARLAELRRGPREERIAEAQAVLAANEALTANARREMERVQDVFDRGLSREAALDQAQTTYRDAAAREQAQRETLASLLNGTTVEELQQATAALAAAEAEVQSAQIDLARLQISAPLAGRIDRVLYELGERPPPGTTVAVVLDGARNYARLYVPEDLRAQGIPGATLRVAVDGRPGTFTGRVRWVSTDASFTPYFALTEHDRSRLSYLAEVDIEGAGDLPSGLPVEAWPATE